MFFLSKRSFNAAVEREIKKRLAAKPDNRVTPRGNSVAAVVINLLSDGQKRKSPDIVRYTMAATGRSNQAIYATLNRLTEAGNIKRVKRGVYQIAEGV